MHATTAMGNVMAGVTFEGRVPTRYQRTEQQGHQGMCNGLDLRTSQLCAAARASEAAFACLHPCQLLIPCTQTRAQVSMIGADSLLQTLLRLRGAAAGA